MSNEKILNRSYAVGMILAILKEGAKHGYSISQEVERLSGRRISFNDGTLYPVLRALEEEGLIESRWEQPQGERKRRIYELNEKGLTELERQIGRWKEFSGAIDAVMLQGGQSFASWPAWFRQLLPSSRGLV